MTSWSPSTAAAYVAANGLEDAFYSIHPNAYGARYAADWMAIWLNAQNVRPPDGPDGEPINYAAAGEEDDAISSAANYVMPFTPIPGITPDFPAGDVVDYLGTESSADTTAPGLPYVDTAADPLSAAASAAAAVKKSAVPLVIATGLLAWLTFR